MTKAIVYTRFSPRRNEDKCESCEIQLAYCEQYAAQKDIDILKACHDKAVSGSDEYRPTLWEAIADLPKGGILLVYKLDRLARNVYLSECIKRAVAKQGASIVAVQGDVVGEGIEQTMIRQVLAAIAEYERMLIGQRTKYDMLSKQSRGQSISRFAPYGWTIAPGLEEKDKNRLAVDMREQVAIKRIAELRDTGASLNRITKVLNEELPELARGKKWHVKTVMKICQREMKEVK